MSGCFDKLPLCCAQSRWSCGSCNDGLVFCSPGTGRLCASLSENKITVIPGVAVQGDAVTEYL